MKDFNKMTEAERAEIKNFKKIKKAANILADSKKLKQDDKFKTSAILKRK